MQRPVPIVVIPRHQRLDRYKAGLGCLIMLNMIAAFLTGLVLGWYLWAH